MTMIMTMIMPMTLFLATTSTSAITTQFPCYCCDHSHYILQLPLPLLLPYMLRVQNAGVVQRIECRWLVMHLACLAVLSGSAAFSPLHCLYGCVFFLAD